uniref:Uncharacterized protein n=1 Tax=Siphoviridae sp. ctF7F8 TaxID=2826211 RepID=A0A8S5MJ28_9CAUD|nr:MAG TPA: hypothetical protein [Siphoviridae sp. ctF7F8]
MFSSHQIFRYVAYVCHFSFRKVMPITKTRLSAEWWRVWNTFRKAYIYQIFLSAIQTLLSAVPPLPPLTLLPSNF